MKKKDLLMFVTFASTLFCVLTVELLVSSLNGDVAFSAHCPGEKFCVIRIAQCLG